MKYASNFLFTLFFFLFFFSFNSVISAETSMVSAKKVQEKIDAIENIKEMDEETKKSLLRLYSKTLDNLETIKANNKQSEFYVAARKQAPKEIKILTAKLEKLEKQSEQLKQSHKAELEKSPQQVLKDVEKIQLSELELKLNSESANLAAVTAKYNDLKQTISRETDSPQDIRKQIVAANQNLEALQESRKIPSSEDSDDQKEASQWALDSHIEAFRSEIKMLDLQLLSQTIRLKLMNLKEEISNHNLKKIEARVKVLKQQVDLKRNAEIKKTQEMTRTEQVESKGKHALIQSLAKSNTELSEKITLKTKQLIEFEARNDIVVKETQRIREQQASTKKKLEIAGLNQIIGQVFWEQKKALPDSQLYLKNLKKRENLLARLGLEHIQFQEEFKKIKETDDYLQELMVDAAPEIRSTIEDDLKKLIITRKGLLLKTTNIDEKYLQVLSELDFSEKKLVDVANRYSLLLDEHLFWLRSATLLKLDNFKNFPEQIQFLLTPSDWLHFANDFINMSLSSPLILSVLLVIIFFLIIRKQIKERLVRTGRKTKKISSDRLLHTWKAIFFTLLLATPLPTLLLVAGWQLSHMPEASEFTHAVSKGMLVIVLPLFSLQVFRYMCLSDGLFEVHFKWSSEVIRGLRKEMSRLIVTFLPVTFIATMLIAKDQSSMNGGLARLFILVILATFALFFYRLLKSESGLLSSVAKQNPQSFLARYQKLLLYFGLLSVAAIMGLTFIGYVYTVAKLTISLVSSVWFVFALIILQQVSVRWLLLTQRKFALKRAIEKRKAALLEKQSKEDDGSDKDAYEDIIEFEEPEIDMISLSEESKKLLNISLFILGVAGFIGIWSEVLPALGIFEKIELWHHEGVIDGTKKLLPVTLGDLGLAVIITAFTLIGAKRLPAIIEILLLSTAVSSGNRYTITTLVNYSIVGIGLFSVFNILGADWARFQWLFAALSVGIGFGLQEIVANFISGLIILFERPIRVGDTVSVGGSDGVVTKIRIRATTILTFDRKELLVPNKEFITGQLLNWTFSDQGARLSLPVGVAYGSDIPKAKELLLDAARENERVLEDPAPNVVFVDFGDNTLNLHLRCYIDNIDNRMGTTSMLNETINEKFNAAGISIAFPQRDVHLDINHPIDIRLQGNTDK